jgi:uncharacterized membrane protein YgdD (TMEM256/DUF423 family)
MEMQSMNKTEKLCLRAGAILLLTGVILGAFAAHALEKVLDADGMDSMDTAVRYQIYHGLALLVLVVLPLKYKFKRLIFLGWTLGTILFSVSIYLLILLPQMGFEVNFLGPVTPVGGSLLILSWAYLVYHSFTKK